MTHATYINLNEYIEFLAPYKSGRTKGLYECPNCTGKLSVNKADGTKFSCYDCDDRSAIRKAVRNLAGDDDADKARFIEERQAAWEQKKLELARKNEEDRQKLTPSVKRHEEILKKIATNPLSVKDKQELIDSRNVTTEFLEKYNFYRTYKGWTMPAVSYDGMMIDGQHKVDGVYKWIAAGQTKRQETGQNPLTVHGNRINPTRIVLAEGLAFKPAIAAENHPDWLVVGASGGQFTSSSQELAYIVRKHPGIPVSWAADGGSTKDRGVMSRIGSTHSFLQSIGHEMSIGWWEQYEKGGTDIDEISPGTTIEFITLKQLQAIAGIVANVDTCAWIGQSVSSKRQTLEHNYLNKQATKPGRRVDIIYRTAKEMKAVIEEGMRQEKKVVHDISPCGSGKSHAFGGMENPEGIKQVIYVNNGHRTPTTKSVEESTADIPSRHDGLFINPNRKTPMGNPWAQRTQPDGVNWEKTQSNCHLAKEQQKWAEAGYANNDEKNVICHGCEHKSSCALSSGDGYGYLYQRLGASNNARITTAPAALPRSDKHDYSKTMGVWDDQQVSIHKELSTTIDQIDRTIRQIYSTDSDLLEELELVIVPITRAFETQEIHGCHHEDIFGDLELPNAESLLSRVMAILRPNPLSLIHKGNDKEDKLAKFGFKSMTAKPLLDDLIHNWLGWILEIFAGKVSGTVSISGKKLTVKHKNTEQADVVKKCKISMIMDATSSTEDVAKRLGIDVSEILIISQPTATFENYKIHMVVGMSSYGKQRVASANDRIDVLASALAGIHGSCSVIDHIKSIEHRALWHRDSTGSNAFEHDTAILAIGMPTPNLGAIADEYYLITGIRVKPTDKDPEYQAFLKRKVASACIQALGRLRAQHRPDKELHFYVACDREDYPIAEVMAAYPGAELVVQSVEDICLDAAKPIVRTKAAIARLIAADPTISMPEISKAMGTAVTTIKGYFRNYGMGFKKGRCLLYRAFIGNTSLLNSDYSNWDLLLSQEYIDAHISLLDSPIEEESKAVEVASHIEPLTTPQIGALFYAIGHKATAHTIELLILNLYLQVPGMKLSETSDSIEDLLEGFQHITQVGDIAGLNDLRDKFHDDKESMHLAASMLSDPAQAMLRELVVMGNRVKELRAGLSG